MRHDLLFLKRVKSPETQNSRIITTYTNDHPRVKGILDKYWHLLTSDPTMGPLVPPVGDLIVQSYFRGSNRGDPCGSCNYYKYMNPRKNIRLPNGNLFVPRRFSNCQTIGVVYLLQCSCGCYYIGETIQKLWQRIYRYIRAMKTSDSDSPLGRHVAQAHSGVFPKISILVIDRVHPSFSGGDFNKSLLLQELIWISNLNATLPPSLNEAFNLKPFLPDFSSGDFDRDL